MFNYPVTEIYSADGKSACVFSAEEHAAKLAEGWLEERPAAPVAVTAPEFELMIAEAGAEVLVVPSAKYRKGRK